MWENFSLSLFFLKNVGISNMILCIFPRALRKHKRLNTSAGSTVCTTVHIVATCSFVLLADVLIMNGCMSYSSVS